jgi:hypothetical protein
MPKYTARVIRTIIDEHAATLSVKADTLEEAMDAFEATDLSEFQDQPNYHSADEYTHHFKNCQIDGVSVADDWTETVPKGL